MWTDISWSRHRANKLYLDQETGAVIHNQNAGDLNIYWR